MKKTTKSLLLGLCAVLLVTVSVLGTVAWLTSTDTIKNTFTVGRVAITMDEAKVNESGVRVGTDRVATNSWKLMPGYTYTKDPTIHVSAGSEDCYLFVRVDNPLAAIEGEPTTASQMEANGWKAVEGQTDVYAYMGTQEDASEPAAVKAGADIAVFETFTVSEETDGSALASHAEEAITVTAYAVQAKGLTATTASEIWTEAGFADAAGSGE